MLVESLNENLRVTKDVEMMNMRFRGKGIDFNTSRENEGFSLILISGYRVLRLAPFRMLVKTPVGLGEFYFPRRIRCSYENDSDMKWNCPNSPEFA